MCCLAENSKKGSHDFDFLNYLILLGYDPSFVVKNVLPYTPNSSQLSSNNLFVLNC